MITRNRQVANANDFLVWRFEYGQVGNPGAKIAPAATSEGAGNVYWSHDVPLQEDSWWRAHLTGYVGNAYTGWGNVHVALQVDTGGGFVTVRYGVASGVQSTDGGGSAHNVMTGFELKYQAEMSAGTFTARYVFWKSGGGSYAPRLYDYNLEESVARA